MHLPVVRQFFSMSFKNAFIYSLSNTFQILIHLSQQLDPVRNDLIVMDDLALLINRRNRNSESTNILPCNSTAHTGIMQMELLTDEALCLLDKMAASLGEKIDSEKNLISGVLKADKEKFKAKSN